MKRIKNNIKNVFIISSSYSLLLYLIIKDEKAIRNTLFIISRDLFSEELLNLLPNHIKMDVFINKIYNKYPNKFGRILSFFERYYRYAYIILFNRINKKKLDVVNLYMHDESLVTSLFLLKRKFNVIEDGLINYTNNDNKDLSQNSNTFYSLNPRPINYNNVKQYHLTQQNLMKDINKIDLKAYWEKLSFKKKQIIYKLFSLEEEDLERLKEKDIIIFTQPFSEVGILKSEEEKVALYRNTIDENDKNKIVIKTHPREKTDYLKYFPNVYVFSKKIPAEIFTLLDVNFTKAYTVHSTAILNMPNTTEKIILEKNNISGIDEIKQLLKK